MRRELLEWYRSAKRDLPWRANPTPYGVWVSEIMLQQTTVASVIPFYERWMARFPTLESLAEAPLEDVLAHWAGLGYYRRARMLHESARRAAQNGIPRNAEEWQKLKGIGRYTAGAIASIAQSERAPLVDGNVARVYSRIEADASPEAELLRRAWAWAEAMIADMDSPGDWNQALMELGATICLPRQPRCGECPLAGGLCRAEAQDIAGQLPSPKAAKAWTRQEHEVWIPVCGGSFGVRQIPAGQWWEGMWEFPRHAGPDRRERLAQLLGSGWVRECGVVNHVVTTHKIRLAVGLIKLDAPHPGLKWVSHEELGRLPMAAPQRKAFALAMRATGLG